MNTEGFNNIINLIEKRKNNVYVKINEELILMYLDVGKYLYDLQKGSKYGDKIAYKAAEFMKNNYPDMKGFTKRNIERMIQFYKTYMDDPIASPLVTQLSWTNNLIILSSTNSTDERHFYLRLSIKNRYSKRELLRQISSSYYQRYILTGCNNNTTKKELTESNSLNTRILDTYSLEFLNLPKCYSEKDLKKSIIINLKNFILEIGNEFSFIGDEYKISVGNRIFYIDLLFYNRELSCLVAFELKIGEFKSEYLSKMNFYLEALDRDVRHKYENPSVGVILCSSKDKDVVEYTLSKNISNAKVSEYKLKLIDKRILEKKLNDVRKIIDNIDQI